MNIRKKMLSSLFLFIILWTPLPGQADFSQISAENYLSQNQQNSPWVTMGLAALGTSNILTDYLKLPGNTTTEIETQILAITATGNDPRKFSSEDLVEKLLLKANQNQLGDPATVNDDIFGVLALVASGEKPDSPVVSISKNFILQEQNSDGGWGWSVSGASDSDTTAAALVALRAAGLLETDVKIQAGFSYLKNNQTEEGGIAADPSSDWGKTANVSTTAWAAWALNAFQINLTSWDKSGKNLKSFLEAKQSASGSIDDTQSSFTPTATAYATIALLGKTLPLKITPLQLSDFAFRIEGAGETVCEGKTQGPTALDIVKNASHLCGYTYHIKDTSFGPYLDKIAGDEASGSTGWQYSVNYNSPQVGAADYQLKNGDEVLWYFGNFDLKLTRLSLDPAEVASGASTQALIQTPSGENWQAIEGAKILVGTNNFDTNTNGSASINGPDGYFKVYGQKNGYVRSNKILLKIGSPSSGNASLNALIEAGEVQGTSTPSSGIAFTINPSSIDFGNLKKGQTALKSILVSNTGTVDINIESVVKGDSLFTDNLQLGNSLWKNFKTSINKGINQDLSLKLTVPSGYSETGNKQGSLIIWAAPK